MSDIDEGEVYRLIGEDGFARLVRAFYAQVPSDPILGAMYPAHDLAGAEQRLRDFLIGRFGGPPRYIEAARAPAPAHAPHAVHARRSGARSMGGADGPGAGRGGPACGGDVAVAGVFCGDGDVSEERVIQNAKFKMQDCARRGERAALAFRTLHSASRINRSR